MLQEEKNIDRVSFFEQLHQEFLFIKGYGTYAYISPRDVNQLYDSYRAQHQHIACTTPLSTEINFMRSYIRSL
jgi:hypothetical protein